MYVLQQELTEIREACTMLEPEYTPAFDTVCENNGDHSYGHNYCEEVAQETCYNVPIFTPVEPAVQGAFPKPIKTCDNKPINPINYEELIRPESTMNERQTRFSRPQTSYDFLPLTYAHLVTFRAMISTNL